MSMARRDPLGALSAPAPQAPNKFRLKNRTQLILFGGFAVLALTIILIAGLWDSYRAAVKNAEEQTARQAMAVDLHVRAAIENVRSAIDAAVVEIERTSEGESINPSEINALLRRNLESHKHVVNMIVADAEGRVVYAARERDVSSRVVSISDRDYFTALQDADPPRVFVGIPVQSRVTGDAGWLIPVSRRLTAADGGFAGIVSAALSGDEIQAFFESVRLGPHGVVAFGRIDGIMIAREPPQGIGQKIAFVYPIPPDSTMGTIRSQGSVDGVARISSYRVDRDLGTRILVGTSLDDVIALWRREARIPLGIWLFCTLAIVAFTATLVRQVARRDAAETLIRAKESDLRAIMDNAPIGIFFKDLDLRYRLINHTLRGWSKVKAQIEQRTDSDFSTEREAQLRGESDREVLAQGKVVRYLRTDIPFNDPIEEVEVLKFPVRNDEGEVAGIAGLVFDITERERDQKALAFERALSQAVEHGMPGFFLVFDAERRAVRWNKNIETLTGPLPEVSGQANVLSMLGKDNRFAIRSLVERTFREKTVEIDGRLTAAAGEVLDFIFNAQRIDIGDSQYVVLSGIDVSERNRAERSLRHTERILQTLRRANRLLVQATDEQYLVAEMCRTIVDIGGYRMAYIGYVENNPEKTIKPIAYAGFEDGYLHETRSTWSEESHGGGRGRIGQAIRSGVLQINHDFMNDPATREWRDAALKRGYRSNVSLPLREGDAVFGALSIYSGETGAFDTTEVMLLSELADNLSYGISALRTRARSEAATDRLLQAEKSLAVSTLASSIAHDFNNLLAVILGFSSLATERVKSLAGEGRAKAPDLAERMDGIGIALDHIVTSATHGRKIVESMNKLIKTRRTELEVLDLRDIVQAAEPFLRVLFPAFIQLAVKSPAVPCRIEADAVQLEQMIFNLCINAVHAIGDQRGRVTIAIDLLDKDAVSEERARMAEKPQERGAQVSVSGNQVEISVARLADAPHVRLTVSDDGCGIGAEIAQKVFTPFFSTKGPGRGTGLGLTSILEIVEAHGGTIHVRSKLGDGTDFMVYLPECVAERQAVQAAPVLAGPAKAPLAEIRTNPAVLVIDDEQKIVDMVKAILETNGYDVNGLTDPLAALELLRRAPDAFDLIITDQTMPRLSGTDLVSRIRRLRADLPVIISTGFSAERLREGSDKAGITGLLPKPYTPEELLKAVRTALTIA